MTVESNIIAKMKRSPKGRAFIATDFLEGHSYVAVKKALTRLVQRGDIRRIRRGVYDIAPYSTFLKEEIPPSAKEFAQAKARNFRWTISPSGQYALNLLGLSTQVPAKIVYASTGPYRRYIVGNRVIEFRHKALRELESMSSMSVLVVAALKALGNGNVTDRHIALLKQRLDAKEKNNLREETYHCPKWMYEIIRKICEE